MPCGALPHRELPGGQYPRPLAFRIASMPASIVRRGVVLSAFAVPLAVTVMARAANTNPLFLLFCLASLLDLVEHEVTIATEPVCHRHELLPRSLIDPHPAAAFMILRCDRE